MAIVSGKYVLQLAVLSAMLMMIVACDQSNAVQWNAAVPRPITNLGRYEIIGADWLDEINITVEKGQLELRIKRPKELVTLSDDPKEIKAVVGVEFQRNFPVQKDWKIWIDESERKIRYVVGSYEYTYDASHPDKATTYERVRR